LPLPPEIIWLDRHSGDLFLSPPRSGATAGFGYDAMPLFWRVALDTTWFGRREADLRSRMLAFFDQEWQKRRAFFDHYALTGEPRSSLDGHSEVGRRVLDDLGEVLGREDQVGRPWGGAQVQLGAAPARDDGQP
ncbi:MAG: hypothetical protein C4293_17945, partial [Nitrospiraceae bacterium]